MKCPAAKLSGKAHAKCAIDKLTPLTANI